MAIALRPLPSDQLAALQKAYSDSLNAKRRTVIIGTLVFVGLSVWSGWAAGIDLSKLINIGNVFDYFWRIFHFQTTARFVDGVLVPAGTGAPVFTDIPAWFYGFRSWGIAIIETLLIAYVGTVIGAIGGFLLCFLASKNLAPNGVVLWIVKRILEFCRTVPEIVFALIFIQAFMLGPLPGVLAIALHTIGALGKQFSDVVENIDMKQVEGVAASGGSWTERIRFAVVPQVATNFMSYALMRFEINVRGAAVMGFVGAGGIGQDLFEVIRKFQYPETSAILVMIIGTVIILDVITTRMRYRLLGEVR
jgi:phosphonate transport system permease protein